MAAKFTETGSLVINWTEGDFDGSAVAWNSAGEVVGRCSVSYETSCEVNGATGATKVGVHECEVPSRGATSPRLEPYCTDDEVAEVLDGLAMPAPLVPTNVQFVDLNPEGPTFAWTHPGGNASTYVAWIDAPNYFRNECRVEGPFEPVVSCTIERLITPGLVYEVHFYAVNDDGRLSPTIQLTVQIPEVPPVEPAPTEPDPEPASVDPDPCAADGKHELKRQKPLDRVERKHTRAVEKWSDRHEERPKKLVKRLKRIEKHRTRRIARVENVYESACSEGSTQSIPAVSPG